MKPLKLHCKKCKCEINGAHYNTPIGRYCIACWEGVPLRERKRLQKEHLNRMMNAGGGFLNNS